jgi:hypothetical protein
VLFKKKWVPASAKSILVTYSEHNSFTNPFTFYLMQNLTSTMGRLAVVLAGALALGSCSRAEYATLPRSASYMGTATATSKARVAVSSPIAAAPAATAPEVVAPVAEAPLAAPAVAPVASAIVAAPTARVATAAPRTQAAEVPATVATAPDAVAAAPKMNLAQRIALAKVTKKLNKLTASASQLKKGDNTAHTTRINGNLRTGIILLLVGLIVGIFSGLIGTIIALIGVIFLVLWLLDEL